MGMGPRWEKTRQIVWNLALRSGVPTCHICGHRVYPKGFEVDHEKPLAEGGTDAYANLRLAHGTRQRCTECVNAEGKGAPCNTLKLDRSLERARDILRRNYGYHGPATFTEPPEDRSDEWE